MRALVGIAALVGLTAIGCGHVETHQALLRAPQPPTGKRVELYMSDQGAPARAFYEIALIQAIGYGNRAHPEDLADALSDKAAKLGCDAILRTVIDQGYTRAHASGVCVRWLGPPSGANPSSVLPPDRTPGPVPVPSAPTPMPRLEPLPSAGPSQGGGR